jgi:hypothetical protein
MASSSTPSTCKVQVRLAQLEKEIGNARQRTQQNTSVDKYELLWDFDELLAHSTKVCYDATLVVQPSISVVSVRCKQPLTHWNNWWHPQEAVVPQQKKLIQLLESILLQDPSAPLIRAIANCIASTSKYTGDIGPTIAMLRVLQGHIVAKSIDLSSKLACIQCIGMVFSQIGMQVTPYTHTHTHATLT